MDENINQAIHNEAFLNSIEEKCPDTFFDWKITIVFYIALHYLRAYANIKKVRIGASHKELLYHSNPNHIDAINPLSKNAYRIYRDLFSAAHNSRYQGFLDKTHRMLLMEQEFIRCKKNLRELKKYLKSQGLKIVL